MGTFYPWIKSVHIAAVLASFVWFLLRAALAGLGVKWAQHAALRVISYGIDTILLTAALMLATILHQYPFAQAWLTMKVLLLVLYLILANQSIDPARSRPNRAMWVAATSVCFACIYAVARAHHWSGPLATWLR